MNKTRTFYRAVPAGQNREDKEEPDMNDNKSDDLEYQLSKKPLSKVDHPVETNQTKRRHKTESQ